MGKSYTTGVRVSIKTKTKDACAAMLHHPYQQAPLTLSVDALGIAVGGILEQLVNDWSKPLAFFCRKLRKMETKYSAFDCELLAMHCRPSF